MKYVEMEQRAKAYRDAQKEQMAKWKAESDRKQQEAIQQEAARCDEEAAKSLEILKALNAPQLLQAVRDEVWTEGEIASFREYGNGNTPKYGLSSVSEPYDFVSVDNQERPLKREGRSLLEIGVVNDRIRKKEWLVLDDRDVFDLKEGETSVTEAVRKFGLDQGLREVIIPFRRSPSAGISFETLSLNEDTAEKLNRTIVGFVEKRRDFQSLPSQIREWNQRILEELPEFKGDILNSMELHEWAYPIRGTSFVAKGLDRLVLYTRDI